MITNLIMKLPPVRRLRDQLIATREAYQLEMERNTKRPARMVVRGLMPEVAIEEALNGTETNPVMKAVCAIINAKIVELADTATDRPRSPMTDRGVTVAGYSIEERLHDAGGATHMAELLAKLQDLARPRGEEPQSRAA